MKAHASRDTDGPRIGASENRLSPRQFATLFQQSWQTLWCIGAAVIGRREEVEDVLQESAVIALTKLDEFDPQTSFVAWMGQIVRFTALNAGRRRQRRANSHTSSEGALDSAATMPEQSTDLRQDVTGRGSLSRDQTLFDDRLSNALGRLSETARACLLLRVVQDLSYRDIALALSIPEGTAMSHVHRAQKTLREAMYEGQPDKDVQSS